MRIISQDKTISVEMESIILKVFQDHIYTTIEGNNKVLGKYADEERAEKVFEELHEDYRVELSSNSYRTVYYMPEK